MSTTVTALQPESRHGAPALRQVEGRTVVAPLAAYRPEGRG